MSREMGLETFVSLPIDDSPGETVSRSQGNQTAVGQSLRHITTCAGL